MPFKILSAEKDSHGYHFRVHLDTERVQGEADPEPGEPHPDWVREWTWGLPQPDLHQQHGKPLSEAQYLDNLEAHIKEQVALEVRRQSGERHRHPGVPVERLKRFHGREID